MWMIRLCYRTVHDVVKSQKHKAKGGNRKISGLWGIYKFHGNVIPIFWLKVDVVVIHIGDIPLMHPHSKVDDQVLV